jgi:hypothetical protein
MCFFFLTSVLERNICLNCHVVFIFLFGARVFISFTLPSFDQDAVSLARAEEGAEAAARKLTEAAFNRGSADNITCIVVRFNHEKRHAANPDKASTASSQHEQRQ